jgi:hypothetical protein
LLGPTTERESLGSADGSTTDLIIQDQERLAERLGMEEILAELSTDPPLDDSAVAACNASLGRSHGALGAMFLGETAEAQLTYASPYAGDLPSRVFHAFVAAVLLLVIVAVLRYTVALNWLRPHPQIAGIALGLFWWLFLWPSALGWLIVAASVVAAYLPSLARRRRPPLRWRWRA